MMNTKCSCTVVLFLIFSFNIMIFLPTAASPATIIWEENFESDGLDNWNIFGFNVNDATPLPGNISDTNGVLRIMGPDTQENVAEYPSTQATGTWSFDVDVTPTKRNHFYIAFFGEKMGNFSGMSDFTETIPFEYGILVVTASFATWDSEFVFYRRTKGISSITSLKRFTPSQILGWHHFDITRSMEGEFNIYLNGSHIMKVLNLAYTTTEVFRISGGPGPGIDNIVVRDDFIPTSTTKNDINVSFEFLALSLLFLGLFRRKRN
ncbi:MAG: hypothetical protein ACFFDT_05415 [Candidatus Hodarchaeota archaeon]